MAYLLGLGASEVWIMAESFTARPVRITDTTFRDAHQSLLATRLRTEDMLAIAEKIAEYRELFANPYKAAALGFIDD